MQRSRPQEQAERQEENQEGQAEEEIESTEIHVQRWGAGREQVATMYENRSCT